MKPNEPPVGACHTPGAHPARAATEYPRPPGHHVRMGGWGRTVGSRQQGMILLQGGWPGTVKPATAHKKAAAARRYTGPARPVAPPNPCLAR